MFGKKKAGSQPFVLQVLTTDYLLEGTVPGNTYLVVGTPISLSPAQIQCTTSAAIPAQTLAQFVVMGGGSVAFIPRGEIEQLEQYAVWKQYKNAMPGDYYVGPYVMRGRMMGLSMGLLEAEAPIFDVHITCQVPGSTWPGLYAPLAVVNTHWVAGYIPDLAGNG
jgi:hypothetical protein